MTLQELQSALHSLALDLDRAGDCAREAWISESKKSSAPRRSPNVAAAYARMTTFDYCALRAATLLAESKK